MRYFCIIGLCLVAGPNLRVVATMSVGFEHIDVEACKERNIRVCNTPNVSTDSVAELTVSLLLLTARRLLEGNIGIKLADPAKQPDTSVLYLEHLY